MSYENDEGKEIGNKTGKLRKDYVESLEDAILIKKERILDKEITE